MPSALLNDYSVSKQRMITGTIFNVANCDWKHLENSKSGLENSWNFFHPNESEPWKTTLMIFETFESPTAAASECGLVWRTADSCQWGDWQMEMTSLGFRPWNGMPFWTFVAIMVAACLLLTFACWKVNSSAVIYTVCQKTGPWIIVKIY